MENTRVIEINGVKIDVDLTKATRIDQFKIGDNVKVLRKRYSDYEVFPGVITDFVSFKELPTICIAILSSKYDNCAIEFINYNAETKDIEVSGVSDIELRIEKNSFIDKMNRDINKKQEEVDGLVAKRDWFMKFYGQYFEKAIEGNNEK